MIIALGDDIGAGDPDGLVHLAELEELVGRTIVEAVATMKANSACSWADVGEAFGIARQTAHERFGRRRTG